VEQAVGKQQLKSSLPLDEGTAGPSLRGVTLLVMVAVSAVTAEWLPWDSAEARAVFGTAGY